ncbi:MAG: hypothetical protein MZU95_02815 [Desulfomicrobium escambiense]|nr:hypothetical protein [Desulfomicrobium escambiense]
MIHIPTNALAPETDRGHDRKDLSRSLPVEAPGTVLTIKAQHGRGRRGARRDTGSSRQFRKTDRHP